MHANSKTIEKITHIFAYCAVSITIFVVLIALFTGKHSLKTGVGSFDSVSFNDGWVLSYNGNSENITLPYTVDAKDGDYVSLTNTLPDNLVDGMHIMTKSSMQDLYIFVDGDLREEYSTDTYVVPVYYLPSTYVVTYINENDSGKKIEIKIRVKSSFLLNEISYGYGNNVWFDAISNKLPVSVIAGIVLAMGIALTIISFILRNVSDSYLANTKSALYLGLLMVDLAIWVFSESELKSLLFRKPQLTHFFVYSSVEMIAVFACSYFNEVQHRVHNKLYLIVEVGATLQVIINYILQFLGVKEFYETLFLSHIWMGVGIVITIICLFKDIKSQRVKNYFVTSIGIVALIVTGLAEIIAFYFDNNHSFGIYLCSGLVIMMITTIIELLLSEIRESKERRREQTQTIVTTVETIASAIDARDKYTGGHSTRVGKYAGIIAREMAADYDFTEDDIQRITYIGLMHDIGKIGVADTVLNKAGKLTDEEFTLMKKHVEIGYELLISMGDNIEGLLDGVRYHHERFDGKGYPDGLSETDIPLVARILCLADCYDAMTSNRVYRKRLSDEEVKAEILRCSGTQFDPGITEIVIRLIERGDLKPDTSDGMELGKDGNVPKSSLLEYKTQQDLLSDPNCLLNPTHVRMLSYVVKLMEKRYSKIEIFFIDKQEGKANNEEELVEFLKTVTRGKDMCIEYTKDTRVMAIINKDEERIAYVKENVEKNGYKFTSITSY